MDHDFYKLDEAATLLGCETKDLLKWGAAGKVELCVWYDGAFGNLESRLYDHWRAKGVPIPTTWDFDDHEKILPLIKTDVMQLFLLRHKDSSNNKSIEVHQLKWPRYEVVLDLEEIAFILDGEGVRSQRQRRILNLTEDDLLLTHETLIALKAELHQTPTESAAQCLDEENVFHAKELKIAIEAWTALFDKKEAGDPVNKIQKKPGGAISAITKWLEKNYPGESGNAYGRIAQVINPFKDGGAARRTE